MQICHAKTDDIPAVAALFLVSFPDSVRQVFANNAPNPKALEDIFSFVLITEPECFFVAIDANELVGYILAPRNMRRIWAAALTSGHLFRWGFRYLTGHYGLGLRPLKIIALNKLAFLRSPYNYRNQLQAQILSLAVVQKKTGRGIGRLLMVHALAYLTEQGIAEVKLEVRPWNNPAHHLYQSMGFETIGTSRDSQGDWLVMVKQLYPYNSPRQLQ